MVMMTEEHFCFETSFRSGAVPLWGPSGCHQDGKRFSSLCCGGFHCVSEFPLKSACSACLSTSLGLSQRKSVA